MLLARPPGMLLGGPCGVAMTAAGYATAEQPFKQLHMRWVGVGLFSSIRRDVCVGVPAQGGPPAAFPPYSIMLRSAAPLCFWWQTFSAWQACSEQGGKASWVWGNGDAGVPAQSAKPNSLRVMATCCPVEHATVVAPHLALRLAWPGALHCTLLLAALAVL